ncbi:hypothetical protein [Streptomyces mangrovisoli]|uniref:Lipoprotein n=1 Tax=Streptomyces mangrovisoli TaxID=1428628 RepID=A0A1J4NVW3_9ACTN|nr:hypothetical protein [Streptomyces mangrovisoli]OIJ65302.1 hypothetical protein WN71_023755 [Streptomyces mangrovisoli]
MTPRRIAPALVAGLAATLLLGACGTSSNSADPSDAAPAATTPAASPSTASTPAADSTAGSAGTGITTALKASSITGLGSVVTDANGMTLYRYDKDEPSPSKWTCKGVCTQTWIPVIEQDTMETVGVESSLLGTVHRNGMKQVTLAGWPLYRYVGDTRAGEANGQDKDRQWHAVTPSGARATTTN